MNRKHLTLIVVIASVLALVLIVAGALFLSFKKPEVSVTEMSPGSLDNDFKGFTLKIVLDIKNGNPFDMRMIEVTGDIYLDGRDVGDIYNSTGTVVPSRGSEKLEITIHVQDPDMIYSTELSVMVEGSVTVRYLMIEISEPFSETKKVFEGGSPPINVPPVASISGPRYAGIGEEVVFDGSGSDDVDGTVTGYNWDLGDGSTDQGTTISHRYTMIGTYTVRLTVEDDGGASHSTVHQIIISFRM